MKNYKIESFETFKNDFLERMLDADLRNNTDFSYCYKSNDLDINCFNCLPIFNLIMMDDGSVLVHDKADLFLKNPDSVCILYDEEGITKGIVIWNHETMNQLEINIRYR